MTILNGFRDIILFCFVFPAFAGSFDSSLIFATANGHEEYAIRLIGNGQGSMYAVCNGKSVMEWAVMMGNMKQIKYMLLSGFDVKTINATRVMQLLPKISDCDTAKVIEDKKQHRTQVTTLLTAAGVLFEDRFVMKSLCNLSLEAVRKFLTSTGGNVFTRIDRLVSSTMTADGVPTIPGDCITRLLNDIELRAVHPRGNEEASGAKV